jgi:hypothetical protein
MERGLGGEVSIANYFLVITEKPRQPQPNTLFNVGTSSHGKVYIRSNVFWLDVPLLRSSTLMKTRLFVAGIVILLIIAGGYLLQTQVLKPASAAAPGERVLGVFEGITPCDPSHPPLPQIPVDTACEQMLWKLTLYQDADTNNPTTYQLETSYGMSRQGSTGLQNGGTALNLEGAWRIVRSIPANSEAVVYQLNPATPETAAYFYKVDDNLLHILDADKQLRVGNAGWSYTLNRTDQIIPPAVSEITSAADSTPLDSDPSDGGIFEGRLSCVESLLVLHEMAANGDCQRVKMRLTLNQNEETLAPTTFEMLTVYVGMGNDRYAATGTWAMVRGTPAHPAAVVIQLSPDGASEPISFMRVDENHLYMLDAELNLLVGDAVLSNTLNRAE